MLDNVNTTVALPSGDIGDLTGAGGSNYESVANRTAREKRERRNENARLRRAAKKAPAKKGRGKALPKPGRGKRK